MTSLNPNFVWSPFHLSVMNSIHHWQHVRERTYNNNNKDGITTHFFYRAAIQVWPKAFDSINSFNWSLLALINCATVLCATRHQLDCREGWTITDVMLGNESQPSVDIAPLIESGDVLGGEKFFFYCLADADDTRPRPSLRRRSGRGFQLWCTVLGFPNHLNGGLGGGLLVLHFKRKQARGGQRRGNGRLEKTRGWWQGRSFNYESRPEGKPVVDHLPS